MEGQELTTRHDEVGISTPPDIVLENARIAARALADVISKKTKPVIMNGEQYLEFEDWQTVGQFYGYTVKTGEAVPVEVDGVKGAKAHAELISTKTGQVLGGAEAYCMRDEDNWNTRPKYEWRDKVRIKIGDESVPWFQLASMAQTRAGAKAFRNRLAWVVVLAGYRPTPAEEIADMITDKQTESGHFCKVHNTPFFMRGKMKSFAHPIGDSGEWCHEPSDNQKAPPPTTDKPPASPPPAPVKAVEGQPASSATKEEGDKKPEEIVGIDMDWVAESIKMMPKWKVGTWLHDHYPQAEGQSVREIVRNLTVEQRREFAKEIQDRRSMVNP